MSETFEVDAGYLWRLWTGRVEPTRGTCERCNRPVVHESDWWVDAEGGGAQCTHGPAWFGHVVVTDPANAPPK